VAEQAGAQGSQAGRALGGMNFFLSDGSTGGGGGGASSGSGAAGFYLSREAMTTELGNLKRLGDRIHAQLQAAIPMWTIQSPGQDPASLRNTSASNISGDHYRGHLMRQNAYLGTIITKMEQALGIHAANNEQASKDIGAQGGGLF
jgi:hypothetical protein